MKCLICQQDTIRWSQRLAHLFALPVRCSGCDSRFIPGTATDQWPTVLRLPLKLFLSINVLLGGIPLILLLAFLFIHDQWILLALIGLMILLLRLSAPMVPDPHDPVNKIIERVQQKKTKP